MEIITSRQNERVKRVAALCEDGALRRETGLCVAHGVKLLREAVRFKRRVETIWVTAEYLARSQDDIQPLLDAAGTVIEMSQSVCDRLTPQRSPQGILGEVALPASHTVEELAGRKRLALLCDIQDPANVGAILRTAAGFGFDGTVLAGGHADPFSPKALRASMGAAFSMDTAIVDSALAAIAQLHSGGQTVAAAALVCGAVKVQEIPKPEQLTIAIGNEGGGLSHEVINACDLAVVIPITNKIESLNAAAAAAILLWEARP